MFFNEFENTSNNLLFKLVWELFVELVLGDLHGRLESLEFTLGHHSFELGLKNIWNEELFVALVEV